MTWRAYQVVFKLKSPLHIGCGKVGNVQRTRSYLTGRVFWGALTMRLTRNGTDEPATDTKQYECYGKKVDDNLAFTYFYPAIESNGNYTVKWPWGSENESLFRRCFLSSYASTALVYPQQAAEPGLLHEVEFISPHTLDEGKQVYLVGYVFEKVEKEECAVQWKEACYRLQMGGERGYGWGDVAVKEIKEITESEKIFNAYTWTSENISIVIQVVENIENSRLLAHTETRKKLLVQGEIEPLVGREWKVANQAGKSVAFSGLCWTPGSMVKQPSDFVIQKFGIWKFKE
ncbi:hypothetical protein H6G54_29110 [Anabaena cylindrica FACHB-243]|uniref:CRISPR type III-associated protein domain-containing protein n=1 Tax=Anabaena cylindrica (strain ATCC 27899 / PCC 7122) TaxID=272123 RepID=K9ZR10_ANACC|nr:MULTISPECIES: RAMP superfamily CRISPR-associated protein [Anabaena]AFZ61189.1 hypothetical protein Anacy_5899 [Anabaena cylindrica PCC 7122]MBD2421666.1 hypothetical protein [Anabaena cylindrica FACHB-243]MBY5280435.1 hypothetical protein [Anabaena sp. CCAP 1446/1C]MBY5308166.1 hypothetical protein [Anabaena sp. CCAP 1446/1C]MCM2405432.1 hypothetical protein [Anabaena sp. CCAP 1446/1C]